MENPNGDASQVNKEAGLASSLALCGGLDATLHRYDEARAKFSESFALYEKILEHGVEGRDYESARNGWCLCLEYFGELEEKIARKEVNKQKSLDLRKKAIPYYTTAIDRMQEDIKANPAAVAFRVELARVADTLGHLFQETGLSRPQCIKYYDMAVSSRRTLWDTKEFFNLAVTIGSNYYQLGALAERDKQPELAQKYFQRCLPFWTLCVHYLEEKGLPADRDALLDREIVLILVRGRLGMHVETARAAAELLARSETVNSREKKMNYTMQSAVGFSFCAVAFPPGSTERVDYFKRAIETLRMAVKYGWRNWGYLETDEDFDALREWPEFQKAIDAWKVQYGKEK